GAAAGTLTIESAAGSQLLVGAGGAGLDGVFVTDANASRGIDVSGGVLTLSDGTVISGGTMTVESVAGSQLLITPGSGANGATARNATLTGVTVTDNSTLVAGGIEVASGGKLTLNGGSDIIGSGTGTLVIDPGTQVVVTTGGAIFDGLLVDDDITS